jgi:hypothetical protein
MQTEEMRLDGNAAAGMLRELFVRDVTGAVATCRACGNVGPIGGLLEYGHQMGIVLRCPTCDGVVLRFVHASGAIRLDPSGIALLTLADAEALPESLT